MYNFPALKSAVNTAFTLKKKKKFKDTESVDQYLAVLLKLDLNNSTVPIFFWNKVREEVYLFHCF